MWNAISGKIGVFSQYFETSLSLCMQEHIKIKITLTFFIIVLLEEAHKPIGSSIIIIIIIIINNNNIIYERAPSTLQSISSYPKFLSASLALLKHWLPMNGALVLVAPRGLGCELHRMTCFRLLDEPPNAVVAFFVAGIPHNKKTQG